MIDVATTIAVDLVTFQAGSVVDPVVFQTGSVVEYLTWVSGRLGAAAGVVADNFVFLLIGVLAGMIIGTIPGMGGTVTLTILLPFTLALQPFEAFVMLSGAVGATTFTGSITAILINTPGSSSNAATLIDGYPMTQKGQSETAITISAISSASGAVLAASIFMLAVPLMIEVVLLFGPSEIFWIVMFAIVIIPFVVADRPLFGIMTAGLGALVGLVGVSPQTAEPRFTFGIPILSNGIDLISMLIGFFAIAEIVRLASLDRNTIVDFDKIEMAGSKLEGLRVVLRNKWLWFRCSLIGLVVGAIPGAGGSAAAFVAYAHAAQSSPDKESFGKGNPLGILAPESANDAKDGGQLFPTLALGIPGSGTMAVFLGALLLHGVFPGPSLLTENTQLVFVIAISVLISNILTSIIGLAVADGATYILRVPIPLLLTGITVLSLTSVLIVRNASVDMLLTFLFAVLGLIMISLEINRIPFLIAFVLAGILERQYHLARRFAGGDVTGALFGSGLDQLLIAIFVLSIVLLVIPREKLLKPLLR
jgi:putative tricarboxylic transport membrane protein